MKNRKIIIDTGPLVAFLNINDAFHEWAKNPFSLLSPPVISCEAVISEACFFTAEFSEWSREYFRTDRENVIGFPLSFADRITNDQEINEKISEHTHVTG